MKKVPLRMCNGCFNMKPKKNLIRLVKDNEKNIELDLTGKKNGRGAYICFDINCLKKARKAKRFERVFKQPIDDEIYRKLEIDLLNNEV